MTNERTPIGIPEAEYIAKRDDLLKSLTPVQKGVFLLVESLWKVEQIRGENGRSHRIEFDHGAAPALIIEGAMRGYLALLPVPDSNIGTDRYFKWSVIDKTAQRTFDWHLFRMVVDKNGLFLRDSIGELEMIRSELEEVLDIVPYPISATDNFDFRFANAAKREGQGKHA